MKMDPRGKTQENRTRGLKQKNWSAQGGIGPVVKHSLDPLQIQELSPGFDSVVRTAAV